MQKLQLSENKTGNSAPSTYASVLARRTLHQLEELGRNLSVDLAPDDLVRQSAGVTLAENQVAILGDCTCEPHMPNSFAQRTAIRAKKDHVRTHTRQTTDAPRWMAYR